ncbi:MAG TPA: NUDIX domain-containing protein [Rhodocyclaceae bacterium]
MKAKLRSDRLVYTGFFRLRQLTVDVPRYDGLVQDSVVREVVERSDVAAAILVDPDRDAVVLVEQFRAGPFAAGDDGWLIDLVAGRIESGDTPEETIRREVAEEAGVACADLCRLGHFYTAPHISSERVWLFAASVDSTGVSGTHGLAHEGEDIRPVVLPRAKAVELMEASTLSLWAGVALRWLAAQPR